MSRQGSAAAQLGLDFGALRDCELDGFEPGPNAEALTRLRAAADGERGTALFVAGAVATGKSHLLVGLCQRARRRGDHAAYVPLRELAQVPAAVLDGLQADGVVCLDDIDAVLGLPDWERALFRAWNACESAGGLFVASAVRAPHALAATLPDLASRLRAALLLGLRPADDGTRLRIVQRMAADRGFELSGPAADLLLRHLPRDMHSLREAVVALDRASLAGQRRVSPAYVRSWLRRR